MCCTRWVRSPTRLQALLLLACSAHHDHRNARPWVRLSSSEWMHSMEEGAVHLFAKCEDVSVLLREVELVPCGAMAEGEVARGTKGGTNGDVLTKVVLVEVLRVPASRVEVDPPGEGARIEEPREALQHEAVCWKLRQLRGVLPVDAARGSLAALRRYGPLILVKVPAAPEPRVFQLGRELLEELAVVGPAKNALEVVGTTLQHTGEVARKLGRLQQSLRAH
mmetsp:Transcript_76670/g.203608  ORF Transcript_76670/g.203608 Transcript_76670/m.203608 type:complete len:222 (-) Transcript_76670:108-773(-)